MIDFNSVLMGLVVIFLIGYGLFMIRRLYKTKIRNLEKQIVSLQANIAEKEENLGNDDYFLDKVININFNKDSLNETEEDGSDPETVFDLSPGDDEEKSVIEKEKHDEEVSTAGVIEVNEQNLNTAKQIQEPTKEDNNESQDMQNGEDDTKENKQMILQSMTINQLRQKLMDNGERVPKNLKKRELINLLSD